MGRCFLLPLVLVLPLVARAADDPRPQPPEREKLLKATPEEFIKNFDKNKDGSLDKDELPMPLARAMERGDRNGAGHDHARGVIRRVGHERRGLAQRARARRIQHVDDRSFAVGDEEPPVV